MKLFAILSIALFAMMSAVLVYDFSTHSFCDDNWNLSHIHECIFSLCLYFTIPMALTCTYAAEKAFGSKRKNRTKSKSKTFVKVPQKAKIAMKR